MQAKTDSPTARKTTQTKTLTAGQPAKPNFGFERAAAGKLAAERSGAMSEAAAITIPAARAALAFEASYEVSSLASALQRMIHAENLDGFGKACCGILIRIEQLGEALSACVSTDPVGDYGLGDTALRNRIQGSLELAEGQRPSAESSAMLATSKAECVETPRHTGTQDQESPSLSQLKTAVSDIDAISQAAFSEIATMSKMALAYMERPEAYQQTDQLANAFKAIWQKSDYACNWINAEAEGVACNYVDSASKARLAARCSR